MITFARGPSVRPGPRLRDAPVGGARAPARDKLAWAGVSLGEAFRSGLDQERRLPALRAFYALAAQARAEVAELLGHEVGRLAKGEGPPDGVRLPPQIGPALTDHPAGPAALAAIGLTALIDARALSQAPRLVVGKQQGPMARSVEIDDAFTTAVFEAVHLRVLLVRARSRMVAVALEHLRLYSCAQRSSASRTPLEVMRAAVLLVDLIPAETYALDAVALPLWTAVRTLSEPFEAALDDPDVDPEVVRIEWSLALALLMASPGGNGTGAIGADTASRASAKEETSENAADRLGEALESATAESPEVTFDEEDPFAACAGAIRRATAPVSSSEAGRPDLVEAILRADPLAPSPFVGSTLTANTVAVPQARAEAVTGELYERSLVPSDDLPAMESLVEVSRPLAAALRRSLYPTLHLVPVEDRYRQSGGLDPRRMHLHQLSNAIWKRRRTDRAPDPRGRAVLLVAADGSGSQTSPQVKMVKLLLAAFLQATKRSRVELLSALYRGDVGPAGDHVPVVEWITHPRKTSALTPVEALRLLPSIPDEGRGAQADALSLAFLLEEAERVGRGSSVYVVVLSDCQWNHTGGSSGADEMDRFLEAARERSGGNLHLTLVALGNRRSSALDQRWDQIIPAADAELADPSEMARRISDYVAAVMRERRGGAFQSKRGRA